MSEENKHHATAAAILPLVGGAQNVTSVAHCMTRLRLGLRDRSLVQDEPLKALPAVMGVVEDDTYQIVLGPGTVARVTPEFEALVEAGRAGAAPDRGDDPVTAEALAAQGAALRAERKARNATPFKLFLRRIANIFVPLIPALIGCGIIAGLNGLLINLHWLPGITPALAAVASGFMALIAVFVGYNTAKEFGGTPILGGAGTTSPRTRRARRHPGRRAHRPGRVRAAARTPPPWPLRRRRRPTRRRHPGWAYRRTPWRGCSRRRRRSVP